MYVLPRETRAGTALLSIQKETQDRTTISMVGKYVCSMKKKICLRRMKLMNRRLYQPDRDKKIYDYVFFNCKSCKKYSRLKTKAWIIILFKYLSCLCGYMSLKTSNYCFCAQITSSECLKSLEDYSAGFSNCFLG